MPDFTRREDSSADGGAKNGVQHLDTSGDDTKSGESCVSGTTVLWVSSKRGGDGLSEVSHIDGAAEIPLESLTSLAISRFLHSRIGRTRGTFGVVNTGLMVVYNRTNGKGQRKRTNGKSGFYISIWVHF